MSGREREAAWSEREREAAGSGWERAVAGVSSVRVRATAAATLVVALALGLAALILVLALRGSLVSSADAEAVKKAAAVAPYAQTLEVKRAGEAEEPAETVPLMQGKDGEVRLSDGKVVRLADPDLLITKKRAAAAEEWASPGEYAVAGVEVATAAGPATVLARVSLDTVQQALGTLYQTLLPGVPALLVVVAAMTWLSVGRALAPVAAIRAKVADITARDLNQRVPVPSSKDEIAALATTVNGTLDRLETAVERHKRFVADAAHELRSPIATLRARLELAEPSELTEEALADVERLQSLAADLLMLAKLDAGEPLRAAELDLGQVAAEAALRARRRPEVRVELDVEPDVVLRGSSAHLDRLVTNLADNAVRHAASTVRVRVAAEDEEAVLEVSDDGPGIPPEQREAVFGRFTRLDEARARDAGGAGLGLPIARDIALLHEGSLVYGDRGFVARFPLRQV
ncbi:HAMP domain-containing protein [Nonomuraea sp. PA05]|uniref:sensor histidine kinase n=1 Tax=Nonomuraea sp. PA05 TaxID=2604466 RepID=UPI0011D60E4B|nr:ATP-binding protein [Nonomuraea sp. PA05]TYB51785.1 HAMP domain-containing protein [Nonomuraea sp. PA05]